MKRVRFIILFVACLFFYGCGERIYTEKPEDVVITIKDEIEVYTDIYLADIIDISNATLDSDNFLIDTTKLGEKTYEVFYKYEKHKYSYSFTINVVDKTNPRIFGGNSKTVEVNFSGNLCNLIMFGDNYDKKANCIVEGEYNLSKVGAYNIKYVVSDSSNNVEVFNATLNVVKKKDNSTTTSSVTRLSFSSVIDKYGTDNTEFGIDVSKWQTDIDFNKVKNAGATFVMMRIGVQKSMNGELEIDAYYTSNIKKAKAAGLKVGVYLYSIATSEIEAINHAKWVIDALKGEKLDLPIVFDWESWSNWNSYNMSFYDINNIANSFLRTVESFGYKGMLYSSKFYLVNIWENKKNYPVWLAHYTSETDYEGDYVMWQLSNVGKIDGVNGDVDINIMYNK